MVNATRVAGKPEHIEAPIRSRGLDFTARKTSCRLEIHPFTDGFAVDTFYLAKQPLVMMDEAQ